MTPEKRADNLRQGVERLVRTTLRPTGDYGEMEVDVWGPVIDCGEWRETVQVTSYFNREDNIVEPPPLSTERQLALSVLLGEPVPLSVLLSACEDVGLFPDGVLEEVRRAERERVIAVLDREVGYRSDLKLAPVLRAIASTVEAQMTPVASPGAGERPT